MPSFDRVLGLEEAKAELAEAVARCRIHHAYLFEGARGSGRTTLARAFAAAVLDAAEAPEEALADHPDFLELPRDVPTLRIGRFVSREGDGGESIQHPPVVQFLQRKPLRSARAVCLVPDAERMGEAAANAFLKTLEEPPGNGVVLLTTAARQRLPATIVSRCRRIRVPPLPTATVAAELEARSVASGEEALALALASEGSLGTALAMASESAAEDWAWMAEGLTELTPSGALRLAEGLVERMREAGGDARKRRQTATALLDLMALHIRRRLREGLGPQAGAQALACLWEAGERLAANVRPELVLHAATFDTFAALRADAAASA